MASAPQREKDPAIARELDKVRKGHDDAYIQIAQGLTLEEAGKHPEAIPHYDDGLKHMDAALTVRCDSPLCVGHGWDRARSNQEKMRRIRKVLEERLNYLRTTVATEEPFSDDSLRQFAQSLKDSTPPSYSELQLQDEFLQEENKGNQLEAGTPVENATEVFCIPDGVQIFFVSPEGHVSAPSSPAALKILRLEHSPPNGVPGCTTFLQVGTWVYPLLPGASPSLHADYGAYMLPDLASDIEGACVGIILGSMIPNETKKHFQDLMQQFTVMKESKVSEAVSECVADEKVATLKRENAEEVKKHEEAALGEPEHAYRSKISQKILEGAELIVWGIQKGSEKVHGFVREQSGSVKQKLRPDGTPLIVNPVLKTSIKYARVASGWTYKVSKSAVKQVGHVSLVIARYLAPKIMQSVEKTLPRSWTTKATDTGVSKMDDVYEVAASGFQGVSMVYVALDNAAKFLAASLIDESVQIVHIKYGETAADAVYTGGNVVMTGLTLRNLGVKGIAKKAAGKTGQLMFDDWRESKKMKGSADLTNSSTAASSSVIYDNNGNPVTYPPAPASSSPASQHNVSDQSMYPKLQ